MTERASFEYKGQTLYGRDIVELSTIVKVPTDIVARALLEDPPPLPPSRFWVGAEVEVDFPVSGQLGGESKMLVRDGVVKELRRDVYYPGRYEYQVEIEYGTFWFLETQVRERNAPATDEVKIDDTYTYRLKAGQVTLLRNGEVWLVDPPGAKAWIAGANRISDLETEVYELEMGDDL